MLILLSLAVRVFARLLSLRVGGHDDDAKDNTGKAQRRRFADRGAVDLVQLDVKLDAQTALRSS